MIAKHRLPLFRYLLHSSRAVIWRLNQTFMLKLILPLTAITVTSQLCAQELRKLTGEAQIELSKYEARVLQEKKVKDLAILNALEQGFGTVMVQGSTTYLKNIQEGNSTSSSQSFTMMATSQVKGELVEVLDVFFKAVQGVKNISGKEVVVTDLVCTVEITGRELVLTPVEFEGYPLACKDKNCVKVDFLENDQLYFYFNAQQPGYLSVFLDDGNEVYCLLPYMDMPQRYASGFPIAPEQDYLFFSDDSKHHQMDDLDFYVDTYSLSAESPIDINKLYVVFSTQPMNTLNAKKSIDNLSKEDLDAGYDIPRSISTKKFQNWLQRNRALNDQLQIKMIDITISKNQ